MAAALVQSAGGRSTSATTNPAFSGATTSGNLVVLNFVADDYNGSPDSGWTQSAEMEQQTFQGGYCWWRISAGETSFSYTIGSATDSTWVLSEWSGCDSSPYDISEGQFQQTSTTSYTTPSITPTTGDRLLVAGIGGSQASGNPALTAPGSWTDSFTQVESLASAASGFKENLGVAYRLVTGDGSTAFSTGASFPPQTAQSKTGLIISFKVAGAAASAPGPRSTFNPIPFMGGL